MKKNLHDILDIIVPALSLPQNRCDHLNMIREKIHIQRFEQPKRQRKTILDDSDICANEAKPKVNLHTRHFHSKWIQKIEIKKNNWSYCVVSGLKELIMRSLLRIKDFLYCLYTSYWNILRVNIFIFTMKNLIIF